MLCAWSKVKAICLFEIILMSLVILKLYSRHATCPMLSKKNVLIVPHQNKSCYFTRFHVQCPIWLFHGSQFNVLKTWIHRFPTKVPLKNAWLQREEMYLASQQAELRIFCGSRTRVSACWARWQEASSTIMLNGKTDESLGSQQAKEIQGLFLKWCIITEIYCVYYISALSRVTTYDQGNQGNLLWCLQTCVKSMRVTKICPLIWFGMAWWRSNSTTTTLEFGDLLREAPGNGGSNGTPWRKGDSVQRALPTRGYPRISYPFFVIFLDKIAIWPFDAGLGRGPAASSSFARESIRLWRTDAEKEKATRPSAKATVPGHQAVPKSLIALW